MFKRVNRKCAPLPFECAFSFSLDLSVYFECLPHLHILNARRAVYRPNRSALSEMYVCVFKDWMWMKCKQKSRTHVITDAGYCSLDCFSNQDNRLGLMIQLFEHPPAQSTHISWAHHFLFYFCFSIHLLHLFLASFRVPYVCLNILLIWIV